MKLEAAGATVFDGEVVVSTALLDDMTRALGSAESAPTSSLVPFFGPTIAGETHFVDVLDLDLGRALLAGVSYDWRRPFRPDERVTARVFVEQVYDRGSNRFGVVVAEMSDSAGELVQRQVTTFIERGQA